MNALGRPINGKSGAYTQRLWYPSTETVLPIPMKLTVSLFSIILFFVSGLIDVTAQNTNPGSVFTVNSVADTTDLIPGDGACLDAAGRCTLRAAIQEANSNGLSRDFIVFDLPDLSVIDLTLGDLTITENLIILGPGARHLTIERSYSPGTPNFRIFTIAAVYNAVVDIRLVKIQNGNSGSGDGGGICVQSGILKISEVTLTSNSGVNGGAITNYLGTLSVTRSLIDSNIASTRGGGLALVEGNGTTMVTNSTITNNSAPVGGGISDVSSFNPLVLVNVTIVGNTASADAQSVFAGAGSNVGFLNSIVGNNVPSSIISLRGSFRSMGHNIVTDARGSTGFINGANSDQVSDNNAIDPRLDILGDHGGQTDTFRLLPGSPAIDAGNNCVFTKSACVDVDLSLLTVYLHFDQRTGNSRFVGAAVDIGAAEFASVNVLSTNTFGIGGGGSKSAFYSGSFENLIDPTTNARFYRVFGTSNTPVFKNITGEIFVIEIKCKRKALAAGPYLVTPNESKYFS